MGLITVEDNKYCCDFCGRTQALSDIYKDGMDSHGSCKTGMFTVSIGEIVANKHSSRVIGYKNGIRTGREAFEPSERKYKKYVVCKDCLNNLERMHYNIPNQQMHLDNTDNEKPKEEINLREWSIPICDLMEDLLNAKDITLPNEDRLGDEGEARIYGDDYFALEDGIIQLLTDLVNEVKKNPDKSINTDTL